MLTTETQQFARVLTDKLAELAEAGDWDAVRAYECTGVNSYAKMVRQYRDRLLAAQAASTAVV